MPQKYLTSTPDYRTRNPSKSSSASVDVGISVHRSRYGHRRSQIRRYSYLFGLDIAITLTILSSLIAEDQQKFYGSEPYTPTKLEWLAVELNSVGTKDYTAADPYLLKYVPIHNEDAILIFVRYHSQLDR